MPTSTQVVAERERELAWEREMERIREAERAREAVPVEPPPAEEQKPEGQA